MLRYLLCILLIQQVAQAQTSVKENGWSRFRFFEGTWTGTGSGQSGNSTVAREYSFIMNETFLLVRNTCTYPPQQKNPKGEVHEDWGLFSRDRSRKLFVLRQFNVEGFVNQYVLDTSGTGSTTIVFVTESIENIPPGWKARESYEMKGEDEFIETFELAAPGKEYKLYSRNHLHRAQ